MATLDISVGVNQWVDVYQVTGFPQGLPLIIQNKGSGYLSVYISDIAPQAEDVGGIVLSPYGSGVNHTFPVSPETKGVYLKAQNIGCKVSVQRLDDYIGSEPAPAGIYNGNRAMNVQFYIESNIKNGLQFEASRLITLPGSGNIDSIFVTGSKPVILKERSFSYSGVGLVAQIRRSPTYTGGVSDPFQNHNDINPQVSTVTLLSAPTVTAVGTKIFADDFFFGSSQNQATGGSGDVGKERIMRPNTSYLLRFSSVGIDTQSQQVSAYITWYEGNPDLPLPAGF
jgi:hypothetical protein